MTDQVEPCAGCLKVPEFLVGEFLICSTEGCPDKDNHLAFELESWNRYQRARMEQLFEKLSELDSQIDSCIFNEFPNHPAVTATTAKIHTKTVTTSYLVCALLLALKSENAELKRLIRAYAANVLIMEGSDCIQQPTALSHEDSNAIRKIVEESE